MISLIRRQIEKRGEWRKHHAALSRIRSAAEFETYLSSVQPLDFLSYRRSAAEKRTEFSAVLDALLIRVNGKTTLDIGPGHGESLDVLHERGASQVHFIEYDPFFFTYNHLKGFTRGFYANHLLKLKRLESGRYDFVWAKGSIRSDLFEGWGRLFPLARWLGQIDRILTAGGIAVICPYWAVKDGQRCEDDVRNARFSLTMLRHGYRILPRIQQHNSEPSYPITFFKAGAKR